jgi:hypothetical protein
MADLPEDIDNGRDDDDWRRCAYIYSGREVSFDDWLSDSLLVATIKTVDEADEWGSMAFTEEDRRLRAELAAELGYFPATLDPADIDRHRRLNAALDAAPTADQIACKYAHLSEDRRQRVVEVAGRAALADLYE